MSERELDVEFAYTGHRESCRDLRSPEQYCRRPRGHDGEHATGFGTRRVRWPQDPPPAP